MRFSWCYNKGIFIVNFVPLFSPESKSIVPPIISNKRFVIFNPKPGPCIFSAFLALKNGWNRNSFSVSGIPIPKSEIETVIKLSCCWVFTSIVPPLGEYLHAFIRILMIAVFNIFLSK